MMRKLFPFMVALIAMVPPVSADLLFDHFGVTLELGAAQTDTINGGTYTPFASDTFAPTRHTDTVDYVTDDWHGSWDFTNDENYDTVGGTVPSGAEPYDTEAMYFDDTADSLLIVIVTSFDPPAGHVEDRVPTLPFIVTGDLAIDVGLNDPLVDGFRYDYGVNINSENRLDGQWDDATSGGDTIGNDLYRTDNEDWYVATPTGAVTAREEMSNFDPNHWNFNGTYVGETTVAYYEYDFGGGAQECRYPTHIIEVTIPRTLLPAMQPGDVVNVGWSQGCRNDGNWNDASLSFADPPDIDTPEPGTLLLMGFGSLGIGWWKRRKKLAE